MKRRITAILLSMTLMAGSAAPVCGGSSAEIFTADFVTEVAAAEKEEEAAAASISTDTEADADAADHAVQEREAAETAPGSSETTTIADDEETVQMSDLSEEEPAETAADDIEVCPAGNTTEDAAEDVEVSPAEDETESIAERFGLNDYDLLDSGETGSIYWALSSVTGACKLYVGGSGTIPDKFYQTSLSGYYESISNISISQGITGIGSMAFYGLENLQFVSLPEGLETIADRAFYATGLWTISFPESLTEIGLRAFSHCESLEEVNFPENMDSIGEQAFNACSSLKRALLPEGLEAIPKGAFMNCSSLTYVSLPSTLKSIGEYAFEYTGLTSLLVPEGVTDISQEAFGLTDHTSTSAVTPVSGFACVGYTGSAAESYCLANGITFVTYSEDLILDPDDPGYFLSPDVAISPTPTATPTPEVTITPVPVVTPIPVVIPKKASSISLTAKTAKYNGSPISIGEADVSGSSGEVTYTYSQNGETLDAAPTEIGTYEVTATVAEDTSYKAATSQPVTLTIIRGSSVITLANRTLTYNKKKRTVKAATISGSAGTVTYTYYTDKACSKKTTKSANGASASGKAPVNAGTYYVKAKVTGDVHYKGKTSAAAKLTVRKASSTITLKSRKVSYTGKAISVKKAVVSGSSGKVTYIYYTNKACTKKTGTANGASGSGKAPAKKGTYYVKAKVAADQNYASAVSAVVVLKIVI